MMVDGDYYWGYVVRCVTTGICMYAGGGGQSSTGWPMSWTRGGGLPTDMRGFRQSEDILSFEQAVADCERKNRGCWRERLIG